MRYSLFSFLLIGVGFVCTSGVASAVTEISKPYAATQIVAHGGGCRKSSPAGMCCHMDNSTGTVHCH